jgi:hypothetical protein
MRSGSFVSTKFRAARFPEGMLIPAFSVSRRTSEMKLDLDQSILLSEEMSGLLSAAKIPADMPAYKINEDNILLLTTFSFL